MPDSDRPSGETKAQMRARHKAELQASGFETNLKRWGAWCGAVTAIIGLFILLGTQVWPWMVRFGVQAQLQTLNENTKTVKNLMEAQEKNNNLLQATIKAVSEQVHANDLRSERLYNSIEALKREVRIRHGVLDSETAATVSMLLSSSGAGGGERNPASHRASPPVTRQQRLQAVTRAADQSIQVAKADVTADFEKDVKIKLRELPKKK
jgi:hypothetical protein